MTTNWIAIYPARLWIAVELPRPCRALPSGRRICPIAIRLTGMDRRRARSLALRLHNAVLPAHPSRSQGPRAAHELPLCTTHADP